MIDSKSIWYERLSGNKLKSDVMNIRWRERQEFLQSPPYYIVNKIHVVTYVCDCIASEVFSMQHCSNRSLGCSGSTVQSILGCSNSWPNHILLILGFFSFFAEIAFLSWQWSLCMECRESGSRFRLECPGVAVCLIVTCLSNEGFKVTPCTGTL